jgi:hypothetical protein
MRTKKRRRHSGVGEKMVEKDCAAITTARSRGPGGRCGRGCQSRRPPR